MTLRYIDRSLTRPRVSLRRILRSLFLIQCHEIALSPAPQLGGSDWPKLEEQEGRQVAGGGPRSGNWKHVHPMFRAMCREKPGARMGATGRVSRRFHFLAEIERDARANSRLAGDVRTGPSPRSTVSRESRRAATAADVSMRVAKIDDAISAGNNREKSRGGDTDDVRVCCECRKAEGISGDGESYRPRNLTHTENATHRRTRNREREKEREIGIISRSLARPRDVSGGRHFS